MNHQRLRGMDACMYILSIIGYNIYPTFFLFLRERRLLIHFKISTSSFLCCFYLSALVNCDDPGSPSNGHKRGSWYWTGESVSFLCDPQYHLTGPATRLCLPSGKWSEIQPSCKYLLNYIHHPHNGIVSLTRKLDAI